MDDKIPNINKDKPQESYLHLTVKDQGEGMLEEVKNQIFEPFFTTKPKGIGAGMGLSVVHSIMTEINGFIFCTSESGKGCQFDLYFPQFKGEISTLKSTADPAIEQFFVAKPSLEGVRILLIDDQWLVRDALQDHLEQEGAQVTAASEAISGAEYWHKNGPYDLLITDLGLPGKPGDKFAKELRELKPRLPVIIVTGFPEKIDPNFYESESCKILIKPVTQGTLFATIHQLIKGAKSK